MTSLDNAMRAFIRASGDRSAMIIPLWAVTFNTSEEAVRLAWERIMSAESLKPNNDYDCEGK
jgi:hypothetical protein